MLGERQLVRFYECVQHVHLAADTNGVVAGECELGLVVHFNGLRGSKSRRSSVVSFHERNI